jgi:hypothetical protein
MLDICQGERVTTAPASDNTDNTQDLNFFLDFVKKKKLPKAPRNCQNSDNLLNLSTIIISALKIKLLTTKFLPRTSFSDFILFFSPICEESCKKK